MKKSMYVIKDDVAGYFDLFGYFVNDAVAIRTFRNACNNDDIPASDLSLYRLCDHDTESNDVIINTEFLCRGGE